MVLRKRSLRLVVRLDLFFLVVYSLLPLEFEEVNFLHSVFLAASLLLAFS